MAEQAFSEEEDNAAWALEIELLKSNMAKLPESLQEVPRDILGQLEKLRELLSSQPQIEPLANDKRPLGQRTDAEIQEEQFDVAARLLAAKSRAASVVMIIENAKRLQDRMDRFASNLPDVIELSSSIKVCPSFLH